MTRKLADPSARLAQLRPVLKEVADGQIVNAHEMAALLRMTWRNLEQVINADPDFPIISRGGMGVPWQFDAKTVVTHMIAQAEKQLARRSLAATEMQRLTGLAPESPQAANDEDPLKPLEIKQLTDALMAQSKLQAMQGQLVNADQQRALWDDVMATLQSETLAFLGKHDPAGQLSPQLRKAIEDHQRALLVHIRDKVTATIEGFGAKQAA